MSKVEQMESELSKLSEVEVRQIREWRVDIIEEKMRFASRVKCAVLRAERNVVGKSSLVRERQRS